MLDGHYEYNEATRRLAQSLPDKTVDALLEVAREARILFPRLNRLALSRVNLDGAPLLLVRIVTTQNAEEAVKQLMDFDAWWLACEHHTDAICVDVEAQDEEG